jgi:hypothetical protein
VLGRRPIDLIAGERDQQFEVAGDSKIISWRFVERVLHSSSGRFGKVHRNPPRGKFDGEGLRLTRRRRCWSLTRPAQSRDDHEFGRVCPDLRRQTTNVEVKTGTPNSAKVMLLKTLGVIELAEQKPSFHKVQWRLIDL